MFQHSKKVEKAARIYGRYFPEINQKKFARMAKVHDIAEYKERDYTPGEIPDEEKHKRERERRYSRFANQDER
ncbi:HD domain-containing protein [Patescibacteria group bacterium]|nr:HD domain-containing protein [Patescibacteria group bacterium]